MPRVSGTMQLVSGNPVITGSVISSTTHNNTNNDIANEITNSIPRDGTAPPTANTPWGNFKITGLGAATARTDAASLANFQDGTGKYIATVGGTADVITLTPSPAITAYTAGQEFYFIASGANTTNVTVNISGLGAKAITKNGTTALVAGDIPSATVMVGIRYDGTQFQLISLWNRAASGENSDITSLSGLTTALSTSQGGTGTKTGPVLRAYLAGLTLSTAGSSATMTISPGQATNSTNTDLLTLSSSTGKTTSSWAVGSGNGGLDTGSIANNTWYHFFVIRRPDTGVVDVLLSLSATSPTMPSNYTQFRRIGSGRTNGSAQWLLFIQDGDYFRWNTTASLDINSTNPGTGVVDATLTFVPTGVSVIAEFNFGLSTGSAAFNGYVYDKTIGASDAPSLTASPLGNIGADFASGSHIQSQLRIRTDTSATIRYRLSGSDASTIVRIAALAYYDSRGKNA